MSAWFYVSVGLFPFSLVGLWFLLWLFRNRKIIRGMLKGNAG